jgi:hypothetical protein
MKAVILALGIAAVSVPAVAQLKIPGLPDDVSDLIGRRMSCDDYAARGVNDADLRRVLRYDEVSKDEAALRKSYKDNAAVLAALNAKWKKIVTRIPVQSGD